tara:strand:+ start:158 stop:703 length:546 start_codon:yes stop_codon:yes gene_type:complete
MAAFKVVQKISSVTGSNSATIALKSGYIRVTPVADSFIEVGTGAEATSDSSLFVPADTSVVFKERVSSSDIVGITTADATTTFTFATGMESPFAVGDTIEVTGATGFNTTSASVTQIIPANYGTSGFESSQSGKVVIGVGSSDKTTSATATASLRRVVLVDVATSGSTKTHISEVQIVGDF